MKLGKKWLIPYLGQEMDKMSLEHLVLPGGEVALRDHQTVSKGRGGQPD